MTALGRITPVKMAVPRDAAEGAADDAMGPGSPRQAAAAGTRSDGGTSPQPSSRTDAPQRGRAGTHDATGAGPEAAAAGAPPPQAPPEGPPALAEDRAAMSGLHRDYLASRIEASVAPPGRVMVILPTVFLALLAVAFGFAWWGHVDIVVTAQGKVVPSAKVKVVQAAEGGVVRAINVAEGDRVAEGDPLVELDPTETGAEREKLARQVEAGRLELARLETLVGPAVLMRDQRDLDPVDYFAAPVGTAPVLARAAAERLAADWRAMVTDLAVAEGEIARLTATRRSLAAQLGKLEAVVPILAEREEALGILLRDKLVARSEYLEVKRRLVEASHEIDITRAEMARAAADIAKARADRDARLARAGAGAGAAGSAPTPGQNPQAPASYTARIALQSDTIDIDGHKVRPTPGMTVTVDVRTGERRLIEFLAQPVLRYTHEGLRER